MKYKYHTCDLETLDGIKKAEKLHEKGLKIISHTPFTVMFEEITKTKPERTRK